jgi:hypothetical protein
VVIDAGLLMLRKNDLEELLEIDLAPRSSMGD